MTDRQWRSHTKLFYGWWQVAALNSILVNIGGILFYTFPVFIGPLQKEFGWSMAKLSATSALFTIAFAFANPIVGICVARYGARITMCVSAIIASITFILMSSIHQLWMLLISNTLGGIALAGTTLVPAQTIVTNWFDRFRGKAMGYTMLGIGVGGLLMPMVCDLFIREFGWRLTCLSAAFGMWFHVIPTVLFFIRTNPGDLNLVPDGTASDISTDVHLHKVKQGLPMRQILTSKSYILIQILYLMIAIGWSIIIFHFIPFVTQELGIASSDAAMYFGMTVGFSIIGRLLFGWLADRLNPSLLLSASMLLLTCGAFTLSMPIIRFHMTDIKVLWLFVVLFGVGMGGSVISIPVLVGRCFGELNFSRIMGIIMTCRLIGVISIPFAGYIFDRFNSYGYAFDLCLGTFVIAVILPLFVNAKKYTGAFVTERA